MTMTGRFQALLLTCVAAVCAMALLPMTAEAGPPPVPNTAIWSGPDSDRLVTDTTPTFHFSSSINGSTFECQVDSGGWNACTSPFTTSPLSDGWHDVEVRATYNLQTDPTPAMRHFKVDHDFVPDTEITSGPGHGSTTSDPTPTFTFVATTGYHGLLYPYGHKTTFSCSIDGGAWTSCVSPYTTPTLGDGLHTFAVRAHRHYRTDATPASRTHTVDRGVPDTTITGGPTEGSVTSDPTPTFSFTSDRAGTTFACSVNGQPAFACSSPTTIGPLADGLHSFSVAASLNGSTDASPALRTFSIDQPDPVTPASTPQLPPLQPLPTGAAATPPLAASTVSIVSAAGTIGATGATRLVLRCSAGSGECEGRLKLLKTIRFHCGERLCFVRKTFANVRFDIASGARKAIALPLTNEAVRIVRATSLDRLLVLAFADGTTNDARKAILLIGRRPA